MLTHYGTIITLLSVIAGMLATLITVVWRARSQSARFAVLVIRVDGKLI